MSHFTAIPKRQLYAVQFELHRELKLVYLMVLDYYTLGGLSLLHRNVVAIAFTYRFIKQVIC